MDNDFERQNSSLKKVFERLKFTFDKYRKVKNNKFSIQDYLEELSPYADKLIESLETETTKYEKGFCNLKINTEQNVVELTFVMLFKNISNDSIEKKELKRYVKRSTFKEEEINELILKSKSFEIKKR